MKLQIAGILLAVALLAGCAESRQFMGASADNDRKVLTGGPITGTTLNDLPASVRQTLQKRVPRAEVADIDKLHHNGVVIYQISFTEPGKNPKVYITQEGKVLEPSEVPQN